MIHKFVRVFAALAIPFVIGCDAPRPNAGPAKKVAGQSLTDEQSETAASLLENAGTQPSQPTSRTKVALLLNWYPEAEHGGFYAAQVHGIYEKYGLDVEIRPGGKTTLVPQELTLGRIQFGIANADDVLIARNQDVALVALMAPIQNGPRCIMVRKDSGIKTFGDIKNMKLQIDKSRPYVPFLKSKGFLSEGVEIVPFFGTVDQLVAGPGVATQGYNFSEPFMARQKGVEVHELMMSEIGYNPYCSLLVSTES
ncbi:MAG: ABC transporter substrate-binding protein, partial [Pirellula sp.]